MVYDAADGYVVQFSTIPYHGPGGGTWKFQNGSWSNITSGARPSARSLTMMAYDARDGYVVLFGGYHNGTCLNDTWKFHGGVWTLLSPPVAPPARCSASMAFDPDIHGVVLFGGGQVPYPYYQDTWKFENGTWSLLHPRGTPGLIEPQSDEPNMVFDPSVRGLILLMGCDQIHCGLRDKFWVFSNDTWSRLNSSTTAPPLRFYSTIGYDSAAAGLIVFGGLLQNHTGSFPTNATWEFDHGAWKHLTPSALPPARDWASMCYDPAIRGMLLVDGAGLGAFTNDTWILS